MDLQMKPFTVILMQSKKPLNQVDMKEKLEIVINALCCRMWARNFFVFVGCITPDVNVSRVNGIHK